MATTSPEGAYEPRCEHSHISHARAKIKDAVSRPNAGFSKEPFRNWGQPFGLSNQALVLGVRAAKKIFSVGFTLRHMVAGYYPLSSRQMICGRNDSYTKA